MRYEYDMKNILLKKLYAKSDGKASPRPFYEKSSLNKSLDHQSEML